MASRLQRFIAYVHKLSGTPATVLENLVRDRTRYSPLYRSAALRHLICSAPLEVTGGRPYLERRRSVRQHLGI
ncbi:hypothetical protein DIE18_02100 [Burkholderia sp. Bp9125]|nr:hypothetical protein DIE18_02100 [Burkholderia sp. Bp9125]